jgi:hypothetical protein
MSSPGQATSSDSNIQLFIKALGDYAERTGVDLSKSTFALQIEQTKSSEDILQLLQNQEKDFRKYRDRHRRLITCLTPAVKTLSWLSGILGEVVSQVSFIYQHLNIFNVVLSGPPPLTSKCCAHGHRCSHYCAFLEPTLSQPLCNLRLCQTASNVTSSYDAILQLFERLGDFV